MIVQFLQLYRLPLPDGTLYRRDQIADLDENVARELIRRNIVREYHGAPPPESPAPAPGGTGEGDAGDD